MMILFHLNECVQASGNQISPQCNEGTFCRMVSDIIGLFPSQLLSNTRLCSGGVPAPVIPSHARGAAAGSSMVYHHGNLNLTVIFYSYIRQGNMSLRFSCSLCHFSMLGT